MMDEEARAYREHRFDGPETCPFCGESVSDDGDAMILERDGMFWHESCRTEHEDLLDSGMRSWTSRPAEFFRSGLLCDGKKCQGADGCSDPHTLLVAVPRLLRDGSEGFKVFCESHVPHGAYRWEGDWLGIVDGDGVMRWDYTGPLEQWCRHCGDDISQNGDGVWRAGSDDRCRSSWDGRHRPPRS